MTTITVQTPVKVAAPRAARPAAALFSRLMDLFQSHSRLQAARRRQAQRVEEAVAVRQYAQRFAGHDPRFAADLLAAADRHERAE